MWVQDRVFVCLFCFLLCPGLFVLVFKIGDAYIHMYMCIYIYTHLWIKSNRKKKVEDAGERN